LRRREIETLGWGSGVTGRIPERQPTCGDKKEHRRAPSAVLHGSHDKERRVGVAKREEHGQFKEGKGKGFSKNEGEGPQDKNRRVVRSGFLVGGGRGAQETSEVERASKIGGMRPAWPWKLKSNKKEKGEKLGTLKKAGYTTSLGVCNYSKSKGKGTQKEK